MRQGIFLALQGAIGALAAEGYSYMKHPGITKRGQCEGLGCNKVSLDSYVPDPSTLHYPHYGQKHGNSWDLCKGGRHCKDGAYGKVDYTLVEEDLVFEFFKADKRGNFVFEEVEIKIQASEPTNDNSRSYSLNDGHCKYEDGLKCHVPYKELTNGDLCPIKDNGSLIFYIQIRIVIVIGNERLEIYSKSVQEQSYWFSIGYTCTKCDQCRPFNWVPEKRSGDLYGSRYEPDYVCSGAEVQVYGTGQSYHPMSEFALDSHPNSCRDHKGYYNKYSYSDLEVSAAGSISVDYDTFASYLIELEKQGPKTDIVVVVDIQNAEYFVTEIAVFVKCDGGIDDLNASTDVNICAPHSWPHRRYDPTGISDARFAITDDFKCRGDYYIAIYVKVCVAEGSCKFCKV